MLIIRTAQLQALEDNHRGRFKRQLLLHLSVDAEQPKQLEQMVESGIADAHRYSLQHESHIARFLEVTLRQAPSYPHRPLPRGALAILMAYGLDATVKLDRYERWLAANPQLAGADLG